MTIFINFEFCFCIPNIYLVQCGTIIRYRFDVRIIIKMKILDIKIKFIKVIVFKE